MDSAGENQAGTLKAGKARTFYYPRMKEEASMNLDPGTHKLEGVCPRLAKCDTNKWHSSAQSRA